MSEYDPSRGGIASHDSRAEKQFDETVNWKDRVPQRIYAGGANAATEVVRAACLTDVVPTMEGAHEGISKLEQQVAALRAVLGMPPFGAPEDGRLGKDAPSPNNVVDNLLNMSRFASNRLHMLNASVEQIRERIG